ncbi:MAG TPA: transposase [Gracilimonas sp.]|uniref:transposase n=1 Tax=Gracilimonas sp. TaxID=1974203 RepID=UPI002D81B767|nr:transposase [Gracilimonas sp.]
MTYLGIDLHTRNMTICAVSSNGKKIGEWKLTNQTDELDCVDPAGTSEIASGIGKVRSWSILAEIGDISRFKSDKNFVSYCRLVPGAADSGGKRRHKSRNKDGNKYLKIAFSQAGIGAVSFYPPVRQFYNKICRRSGKHVARTVVAKELARIVYFMLSRNEPYKGFKGKETPKDTYLNWPHSVSPHSIRGRDRAVPSQSDVGLRMGNRCKIRDG